VTNKTVAPTARLCVTRCGFLKLSKTFLKLTKSHLRLQGVRLPSSEKVVALPFFRERVTNMQHAHIRELPQVLSSLFAAAADVAPSKPRRTERTIALRSIAGVRCRR
jgi:hypothetical protein